MIRARCLPLLACVLIVTGCAGIRWVPLPDGAAVDPAARSATQSRDGVTITVQASAWRGSPAALESYVTPLAFHVVNGGAQVLLMRGEDLVLFDEQRRQSTPLPPERVAAMFWSAVAPAGVNLALSVEASSTVRPIRHRPFLHDPFFWPPWWWEPWPPPERVDDVFLQALPLGRVYPGAQVRGFVYFTRVDPTARHLTLHVGYAWEGAGTHGEMIFTFAAESAGTPSHLAAPAAAAGQNGGGPGAPLRGTISPVVTPLP